MTTCAPWQTYALQSAQALLPPFTPLAEHFPFAVALVPRSSDKKLRQLLFVRPFQKVQKGSLYILCVYITFIFGANVCLSFMKKITHRDRNSNTTVKPSSKHAQWIFVNMIFDAGCISCRVLPDGDGPCAVGATLKNTDCFCHLKINQILFLAARDKIS